MARVFATSPGVCPAADKHYLLAFTQTLKGSVATSAGFVLKILFTAVVISVRILGQETAIHPALLDPQDNIATFAPWMSLLRIT